MSKMESPFISGMPTVLEKRILGPHHCAESCRSPPDGQRQRVRCLIPAMKLYNGYRSARWNFKMKSGPGGPVSTLSWMGGRVLEESCEKIAGHVALGCDIRPGLVPSHAFQHEHWPMAGGESHQCQRRDTVLDRGIHLRPPASRGSNSQCWTPNGTSFLLTVSSLIEAFIGALNTDMKRESTMGCGSDPPSRSVKGR